MHLFSEFQLDWETFKNLPSLLQGAIVVVGVLIILASIVSVIVSISLSVRYMVYNRKKNSIGMTGQDIARKVLDNNGLQDIQVKCSGSMLFGNSYSHYFKKVRLRRLTWKKDSVTSLAMATEKSALAVLDKEGDEDMKARIKMTPMIYFGPLAFVPLVIIGVLLDALMALGGVATVVCSVLGLGFYVLSFVMALKVLKTEKKAQDKAVEMVRSEHLGTEEEIEDMKALFKIYNIEYVNDMVIALLELIWRILMILANVSSSNSSSSNN